MLSDKDPVRPDPEGEAIDPADWQSRIIHGRHVGVHAFERPLPDWLEASYARLRSDVMDPAYPCFFGTQAEKRGEMFYAWVDGKDTSQLPATMATFAELATQPQYEKNNIAVFFEPDPQPLSHDAYHDVFWHTLQYLHDHDPDPKVGEQLNPSHPDWEFSFAGLQTFVVCACPSFGRRHSRNLGPGMVLLFQPRSVFVDKVTNRAISTQARAEVRRRLHEWDEVPPHPDLGYFGDTENREWKQYFLPDADVSHFGACPFLRRNPGLMQAAIDAHHQDNAAAAGIAPHEAAAREPTVAQRTDEPAGPVDAPASDPVTLLDAIAQHVARHPEQFAIRFLADGETDEHTLTYRKLDARARQWAATLLAHTAPGERAMLLLPSGLDYAVAFLGCLHAGIIAVPLYPPEPAQVQPFERLLSILDDAAPRLLVTDSAHADAVRTLNADHPWPAGAPLTLCVDAPPAAGETTPASAVRIDGDTVAFLQYTSGSTSTAKGVMVTHANLVANERAIGAAMAFTSADTMVSWLPLFHDMGLIGGLLAPLFTGFPVVLMAPQHFLEAPARWLKAIGRYGGTVSGGPNFAFQLCAERVRDAQLEGIALDRWRVAFCGSEPIRAETLKQFSARFAAQGFGERALFPCYGLAEATLFVSGAEPGHGMNVRHVETAALAGDVSARADEQTALVSCGRVAPAHAVRIVASDTQAPLAEGLIGEIWVSGPSVAAGYWCNAAASAETFVADAEGRWLRTGDLGCLLDGELYVTGRVKDLIIVRGQNHYPQDIEATLCKQVTRVRKGRVIAFPVDEAGAEGIGIAAEVPHTVAKTDPAELFAQIRRAVAEAHGEPASVIVLLAPGTLPRTSSGKLRRSACASGWRNGTLSAVAVYRQSQDAGAARGQAPYRAPSSSAERHLAAVWEAVFGHAPIGVDDDFFELGGDSLKAARLTARIGETCRTALSARIVFESRTIAAQAARLAEQLDGVDADAGADASPETPSQDDADPAAAVTVADGVPLPLSPAQEGLYFEWRLDPASTAYHVCGALRARGALDAERLRDALARVSADHDALRVRFDEQDGVPCQIRTAAPRFDWHVADLSSLDAASREAHLQDQLIAIAHAPFDLHHDALLRVALLRIGPDEHIVQLTMHHIIADAWSIALLVKALFRHYDGVAPAGAPQRCAYFPSIGRARRALSTATVDAQLDYWRARLGGEPPAPILPPARRHVAGHPVGGRVTRQLSAALVARLDALSRRHGATLPMTLMAVFAALLYRFGGQPAVRIGVPMNARHDADTDTAIGYFVNTVVVHLSLAGSLPFDDLLHAARDALLDAQANQDVPFHRVVAAVQPAHEQRRAPLFRAVFNFDQVDWRRALQSATLDLQHFEHSAEATPFDLALNLRRDRDGVALTFDYPLESFDSGAIKQLADAYLAIAACAAEGTPLRLRDIAPHRPGPAREHAQHHAAPTVPVTERFMRAADTWPQRIALECDGEMLTYRALDEWSDRIAHDLLDLGVAADACVGLCAERSPGMIAALLGIWKANAAFVPLDPVYPEARLRHMLDDARVEVVVGNAGSLTRLADVFGSLPSLDLDAARGGEPTRGRDRFAAPHPEQLAYAIYTSGSTGLPKGVAISHRALSLHLTDFIAAYAITGRDCQLQSSTINFDVALHEMLPALLQGGRVVMRGPQSWDLAALSRQLSESRVTFARIPTAYWQQWLQTPPPRESLAALRQITVGGEALPGDALARWQAGPLRAIHVDNLYGPTETTVACLRHRTREADAEQTIVQIGKPFASRHAQVVDADGNAVPPGGVGELCIGGATLARGYLGHAALTAERFVPDPDGAPGARCYRSGDLCRQRDDGGIDFLGRIDRQIKLRGFRVEPGEIEAMLRQCEGVRDAAVEARAKDGRVMLVGYVTGAASLDLAALRDRLAARLPSHMVPTTLVRLDALPLMLNGKIDRHALPEPPSADEAGARTGRAPDGAREAVLMDIWRTVLGTDAIGVDDDFFAIGGDSILSLQVVARAAQCGLHFTLKQFYAQPVIARLAALASNLAEDGQPPSAPVEEWHDPLPLAPMQAWFFERFPEGESHWNQTIALRVHGELDPAALEQALQAVVRAHDALRLTFVRDAQGWRQQVLPPERVPGMDALLDVVEFDDASDAPQWPARLFEIGTTLQRGLDIQAGRLFKAAYVRLRGDDGRLLFTAHHLAVDGVSWRVLLDTFRQAYDPLAAQAPVIAPSGLPWSRWIEHQQHEPDAAALDQAFAAWRHVLRDAGPREGLPGGDAAALVAGAPAAGPRALLRDSATYALRLPETLTASLLRDAPSTARTTTETLLFAALGAALARWSGAHGALVAMEGHGRETDGDPARDIGRTVGWFTTRFPVWCGLQDDPLAEAGRALRAIPRRGIDWHRVRARFAHAQPTPQIGFNYLGRFDDSLPRSGVLANQLSFAMDEAVGEALSADTPLDYALDFNAWVSNRHLTVSLRYDPRRIDHDAAHALLADFESQLAALAHRCMTEARPLDAKDFPLTRLDAATLDTLRPDAANVQDIYPATPLQKGLLFHALSDGERGVYVNQLRLTLDGPLQSDALRDAWQAAVARHDILRTRFAVPGGADPLQIVQRRIALPFDAFDWSARTPQAYEQALRDWCEADRRRGFDLSRAPLLRLALFARPDGRHDLVRTIHHALLDGWSSAQLLGEIADDYAARVSGRTPPDIDAVPYRHYVEWLAAQTPPRDWWLAQWARHPEPATLLQHQPRAGAPGDAPHGMLTRVQILGDALVGQVRAAAQRHRVTVNTLVQAAWALVIARRGNHRHVAFGTTVSGRPAALPDVERMVGLFINSLPVWVEVPAAQPVSAWLRTLHAAQGERHPAEHASLADVQQWSGRTGDMLFDSLLVFENYPVDAALRGRFGSLTVSGVESVEQTHYPLTILVSNDAQGRVVWLADRARIADTLLSALADGWRAMLAALCAAGDPAVGTLSAAVASRETPPRLADHRFQPIGARLAAQAARRPDAPAVRCDDDVLNYATLDAWSNRIGRRLMALGAQPEQRIGVCVERSGAMVAALYGVAKTGAAYVPLDPGQPPQRLRRMLDDAGVELVVVDATGATCLADCVAGRTLVRTDDVVNEAPHGWQQPIDPQQAAYVIYTSGSTGEPKGVCVTHGSLDRLLASVSEQLTFNERDVWLSVTTLSFDIAGLELHLPLTRGACVELATRDTVLDGARLLRLLVHSRATVMQATPAGWRMLIDSEARAGLALRGPLQALCGGEALPADLAEALLARGLTLSNLYGPTETTIWSSLAPLGPGVPITLGRPLHDTVLRVLDADGLPTPAGAVGELCIGGDNLARGYLGRAAATAASFAPDPFGPPGARLYRTGDLCRRRDDGGLDYLGRLDQQLKLRGHRIEPAEIEAALRALDGIQDAAVTLRNDGGAPRLVAYVAGSGSHAADFSRWRAALAERLPAPSIPTAWVTLDALPLTSSGKLDRRALPAPGRDADTPVAPRNPFEARLLEIWRALLPNEPLGVTTDFFAAGGDSITSLRVVGAALEAGLVVTPKQVFEHPTIERLARVATAATHAAHAAPAIDPPAPAMPDPALADALALTAAQRAALQDLCVATPLQQGLLSLAQRTTRDPYHLQRVFELNGPLDARAFAAAWQAAVDRHAALRTDFRWEGLDAPVQLVHAHVQVDVQTLDWRHLDEPAARDALASHWRDAQSRGFDFAHASQAQLWLIERGAHCHWFVWRFHHAQLDGWSIGLVLRDVLHAYDDARLGTAPALPAAPAFSDYVRWLDRQRGARSAVRTIWRERLAGWSRTPLPMAGDSARRNAHDAGRDHAPLEHTIRLPASLSAQAERFARDCGVTLNTLVQGTWAWLLARHANCREVSFGVTVSGRGDGWPGAGDTAGLFINTLPLSVSLPPALTVRAWLNDLQASNLSLQALAQTPLATLQHEIAGAAGEPLFDSIFVFENYPLDASLRAPLAGGLAIERLAAGADGHAHDGRNHFALSLIAVPGDELTLTLAAQPARFDGATVRRLLAQLQLALSALSADAARPLGAVRVPADDPAVPPVATWHGGLPARVARHAAHRPAAIALRDATQTLDWATLWRRAGDLAVRLAASGVRAETVVAVVLPRRTELVVAMLAIWRAGGVYAPLDPSAPAERLDWQIRDAGALCVIAEADANWRPDDVAFIDVGTGADAPDDSADTLLPAPATLPADLGAYLIYTSGSTGAPKGVLVSHRALAAYVDALLVRLPDGIGSAAYLSTPAADLGHSTLMTALWSGWTLHLVDDAHAFDADRYADWCRAHPADLLKIAPGHLEGLLQAADAAAVLPRRALLLGGEAAGDALLEHVARLRPDCAILGHYGPTETTIGVTVSRRDADGGLPLGEPLGHARVCLLDLDGHPALPGARGELHAGGGAIARGYRGRPALTAERFIPDPFVAGARLYRTGDEARVRDDGQIEFLGRTDDQLKIRGYRVEPAEVAAQLRALPGVRDAVAIGRPDAWQRTRLIAYAIGVDLDAQALRDALAARLPAAFVPASIVVLDTLPLTRNGKVDRRALPEPRQHEATRAGAEPDTLRQRTLLDVWRQVLRQPALGIDDDFFSAGGDSINAFRIIAQARRAGLVVTSRDLFAQPTVRALAALAQPLRAQEVDTQPAPVATPLDADALAALGFDPQRVHDAYPATAMQQGLLFHSLAQREDGDDRGGMYVTQRRLTLAGPLDVARLRAAWQRAAMRHDILRTRFEWRGDTVWQVVERNVELPFGIHDARGDSGDAYEARFAAWMRDDLVRGFDIAHAPLMRIDLFARPDGRHDLVWTTHHALLDGWSAARLLAEIGAAYRASGVAVGGADDPDEACPPRYRAYVDWLAVQPDSRDWWRAAAAACDDPATLTASLAPPLAPQPGAFRAERALGAALDAQLRTAAGMFGVTLNTLMQGAWALLLARFGNSEQVAFGVTVSGRPEALDDAEHMLGLFINSLPIWVDLPGDAEIGAWLRRLQQQAADMRRHEHTPLVQLQRWVGRSGDALFDSLFVFENYPLDAALDALGSDDAGALHVSAVQSTGRTHYPLTLMVVPQPTLRLEWEWDGLRLDAGAVDRLARAYVELLAQLAQRGAPDAAVVGPRTLRSLALETPVRPALPLAGHAFVPVARRVTGTIAANPDRIALTGNGDALTGRELAGWAAAIAGRLRAGGVQRDACVAVCVDRAPALIASMLGVWMAGGAYLPVDPAYPQARMAAMLDDARVEHVVTDADAAAFNGFAIVDPLALRGAVVGSDFVPAPVHPEQLAYVIYTSGSTGRPKGVGVTHGALDRLLASIALRPGLRDDDLWLSESAPVFDISLLEFCLPLVRGIPLEIVSARTARDGIALAQRLDDTRATVFQATPSGWRMLIEAGWRADRSMTYPPLLGLSGGEALPGDLASALIARGVTLWNLYGPTETTIYSAGAPVEDGQPITHGDPLPDTVLRVFDRHGLAVPDGGLGELCIGGANLARGYLARPGLTAERFVPDPDGAPGARLYRTGDLCRLRGDGRPEPFGRLDQQVKLRGFRIEPGEIEAALRACDGVKNAAVALHGDAPRQRLIGYVTGRTDIAALRARLAGTLPAHMVPSAIVALDAFPLTPSGKLDRRALPEPAWLDGDTPAVAPRSPREAVLLDIWQTVLGHPLASIDLNFFEAGGDSILSLQLISRLRGAGWHLTPRQIFEHPTIAQQAPLMTARRSDVPNAVERHDLLPLTPIQAAFFAKHPDGESHWNQSVLLEAADPLDAARLDAALAALVRRHDALRLRFVRDEAGWRQRVTEREDAPLLRSIAPDPADWENALANAGAAIQQSLDIERGPLLRAAWFEAGARRRLLIAIHHLAVDGVSWRVLLDDLRALYAGAPLPSITMPWSAWVAEQADGAMPDGAEADYWNRTLRDAWPVWRDAAEPAADRRLSASRTITTALDADTTRHLLQHTSHAYRTRPDDLLLAALAHALRAASAESGIGDDAPFLIELEAHGRSTPFEACDLDRTVGWFTVQHPFALPHAATPAATLVAVKESLRAVPAHGFHFGRLRAAGRLPAGADTGVSGHAQVRFNYLGQFDQALATADATPDHPRLRFSADFAGAPLAGHDTLDHRLDVTAIVVDGALDLHWRFSPGLLALEQVERIAAQAMRTLRALIDHCVAAPAGTTAADFPLAGLRQDTLDAMRLPLGDIEDIYPATPLQQGLLFHSLLNQGAGMYVNQLRLTLDGALDTPALRAAWQDLLDHHAVLRTHFELGQESGPLQVVHRHVELPFAAHDFSATGADYDARLAAWLAADLRDGFEPGAAPLMRVALFTRPDGAHDLVWTSHHALLDGWSSAQLLAALSSAYRVRAAGAAPSGDAAVVPPYRDYVRWLAHDGAARDHAEWWRTRAANADEAALLAAALARPRTPQPGSHDASTPLDDALHAGLQQAAQRAQVTLNTLMQGAWAILVARYGGRRRAAIGVTVSGRPADLPGVERMTGLFINSVPLWVDVPADAPAADWLRGLQALNHALREHEHTPVTRIQQWAGRSGDNLFDTLFVFENYPLDRIAEADNDGLSVRRVLSADRTHYPLTLAVLPRTRLDLQWSWDGERFDRATIDALAADYVRILTQLAQAVTAHCAAPGGQAAVLGDIVLSSGTLDSQPRQIYDFAPVMPRFSACAARQPDAIALACRGETLSYSELDAWSDRLGWQLHCAGVRADARVGVCVTRGVGLPATLFGIWKAGGAYLPLDPAYPPERLRDMLDDAGVRHVVADDACIRQLGTWLAGRDVIRVERAAPGDAGTAPPPAGWQPRIEPDQLAYVIYTSGSTGKPKGVALSHRALSLHLADFQSVHAIGAHDVVLQSSTINFDVALHELLPALLQGGRVEMRGPDAWDIDSLNATLVGAGVTFARIPTSLWRQWHLAAPPADALAALRQITVGGEALAGEALARWHAGPLAGIRLDNLYGPTETAVAALHHRTGPADAAHVIVPIGRPYPGRGAVLLDEAGLRVPPGGLGELCIGGDCLARGYLGRAAPTAAQFVPDPEGPPGARLYRTGDLCRVDADGTVQFLGRIDQQIKLRGQRIEPGEIEATLRQCAGVTDALVALHGERDRERLVAYVVGDAAHASLTQALRARLPEAWVPTAFVTLERLPLLPNGKLDRRVLPVPEAAVDAQPVAPRGPVERAIADVWQDVLGVPAISVHDNFHELGGHSLLAVQIAARLTRVLQRPVALATVLAQPTVARLAAHLADAAEADAHAQQAQAAQRDTMKQLLAELD